MKITKEIEEFINLTITEHMGKEYADWKLSQLSVTEPDEVEEEYKKVIATLPQEHEETITKYCDQILDVYKRQLPTLWTRFLSTEQAIDDLCRSWFIQTGRSAIFLKMKSFQESISSRCGRKLWRYTGQESSGLC